MDVANDVEAMKELVALGVFRPPVVKVGERWVRAGPTLGPVAELLGIEPPDVQEFTIEDLYNRLSTILEAAQRYIGAMPADRLRTLEVPRRKRDMRELGTHIFLIPLDLMEAVEEGKKYIQGTGPIPDEIVTTQDIIAFGDTVRARLDKWYKSKPHAYWDTDFTTDFGTLTMHEYFLRTTWHSGQHSRQFAALLESIGIEPPGRVPDAIYAGLPMPERLWE